jgi:uncharacterized protein YecE (DUF72 family)
MNHRPCDLHIGPAGWAYRDWEGVVYPPGKPRGFDPLGYLARYFDCVEINTTFYRMPSARVAAGWAARTRDHARFRFTVKLHRSVTHEPGGAAGEAAGEFRAGISPLVESGRLGCVLAQFPWSFKNSPEGMSRLERLIDSFSGLPVSVEVRHASWNTASFYDFLAGRGVGFCNIDQPLFPASMRPSARSTSPVGYFRLHGLNYDDWFREGAGRDARYDYLYTVEELERWASRIQSVAARVPRVYVIMNNHYKGKAACNALELKARLSGARVEAPPPLIDAFPRLRGICLPAGPDSGMLPGF